MCVLFALLGLDSGESWTASSTTPLVSPSGDSVRGGESAVPFARVLDVVGDGLPLRWVVDYEDAQGIPHSETYDYVVLGTGFNSTPYTPEFKHQNQFKGKVLHALHNIPLVRHSSIMKTYKMVRERFSWKGLKQDVHK